MVYYQLSWVSFGAVFEIRKDPYCPASIHPRCAPGVPFLFLAAPGVHLQEHLLTAITHMDNSALLPEEEKDWKDRNPQKGKIGKDIDIGIPNQGNRGRYVVSQKIRKETGGLVLRSLGPLLISFGLIWIPC